MRVTFQVEDFASLYPEAAPLLEKHWLEVAPYKDLCWLNPDVGAYEKAQAASVLWIATARDGQRLVGYLWLVVAPHLHYKHVLQATDDIHFLHPAYRNAGLVLKFFRFAEHEMRKRGVGIMTLRTKAAPALNHGAIFERLGYDKQDIVYTKRL